KRLDMDKNGYLDQKEAQYDQTGFLRQAFNIADRDGDGKLYEKELTSFLDLIAAAADSTITLQLADQGRGLFELIDGSKDSRLAVRECRTAWDRIGPWDRNGDGLIEPSEVPKFYNLRVDQGQFNLGFYAAPVSLGMERLIPAAAPKGPLWFRK